jgi:hypothetical protein
MHIEKGSKTPSQAAPTPQFPSEKVAPVPSGKPATDPVATPLTKPSH